MLKYYLIQITESQIHRGWKGPLCII